MSNRLFYSIYALAVIAVFFMTIQLVGIVEAATTTFIVGLICLPIVMIAKNFAEAVADIVINR